MQQRQSDPLCRSFLAGFFLLAPAERREAQRIGLTEIFRGDRVLGAFVLPEDAHDPPARPVVK